MPLESKIDELIAALGAAATAFSSGASKKAGKAEKTATESTPPASSPASTPASAPATGTPASQPVVSTTPPATDAPDPKVLIKATEKVIELANEYSRDAAVAILAKRKVTKCSQLDPSQWQAVYDEAEEAIDKAKAAAASASLV